MVDPPAEARRRSSTAAGRTGAGRSWPARTGDDDLLLGSPIILYDHPEVAAESAGALFDSTEIDEILTLRVMTMTDAEKAEARATDPRAAEIIDRCDAMSPAGPAAAARRVPRPAAGDGLGADSRTTCPGGTPRPTRASDPATDAVVVAGVRGRRGSLVRVHPTRRADAQDLFFADQVARVTAVLSDVDGGTHVALVLVDDPAADLHEWYGRYLYFAPEEIEPLHPSHERRADHENHRKAHQPGRAAPPPRSRPWSGCRRVPDVQRYLRIRRCSRPEATP